MWTVISPGVGVPIGFLAFGLTSLYIHFQVMFQTDWFKDFLRGAEVVSQAAGG